MKLGYVALATLMVLPSSTSSAQSLSGGASVHLVNQFSAIVTQGINLGKFRASTNGQSNTFTLDCDGALNIGGAGSGATLGGQQLGYLTINADPNTTISLAVNATTFSNPGIIIYTPSYWSSKKCYSDTQSMAPIVTDATGHVTIKFGALGQIASLAPAGIYNDASYQLTITYQ